MILYTLEDSKKIMMPAAIYAGVTLFCAVFSIIYNIFAHGVHSPYMTWLFVWPLVLGVAVEIVAGIIRQKTDGGRVADIAECIYNSGVAALTVSSMLRGIMDIAGTGSVYQVWMLYAGTVMAAAGAVIFAVAVLAGKSNGSRKYN